MVLHNSGLSGWDKSGLEGLDRFAIIAPRGVGIFDSEVLMADLRLPASADRKEKIQLIHVLTASIRYLARYVLKFR